MRHGTIFAEIRLKGIDPTQAICQRHPQRPACGRRYQENMLDGPLAIRETHMTTPKQPPRLATGQKTYTCYGCGKKIYTDAEIVENEHAEYCETCYRDKYFYHTAKGGKEHNCC